MCAQTVNSLAGWRACRAVRACQRFQHDPDRERKLLLHKREIRELWDAVRIKGMTIVPVRVYLKAGRAKLELAIAKGRSSTTSAKR
jgi:tmRNA-binding protein